MKSYSIDIIFNPGLCPSGKTVTETFGNREKITVYDANGSIKNEIWRDLHEPKS